MPAARTDHPRRVAVAGGTGLTGRHVVALLREAGHEAVVLARSCGVDVTTGAGLDDALRGVDAVVDVTNVPVTRRGPALAFFATATTNLLDAGARAGVGHHVALSIVGCDRVPLGLYAAKVRQEELVLAGAVPGTVLRATQFHEFAGMLLDGLPGPVAVVPRMRCRPVSVREVAAELVRLATGEPQGRAPELAGPREEQMADLARRLARARGLRRRSWACGCRAVSGAASRTARCCPPRPAPGACRPSTRGSPRPRLARRRRPMLADPAARRTLLRVALGTLAVSAAAVGVPALVAPRAFFDGFPFGASWVAALPPFNAHLVGDVGGLYLAFALLFAWAVVTLARGLVVPLCVAWSVFAVLHLGFHVTHLDGFGVGDAVSQGASLAVVLALPALCVALHDAARPG